MSELLDFARGLAVIFGVVSLNSFPNRILKPLTQKSFPIGSSCIMKEIAILYA